MVLSSRSRDFVAGRHGKGRTLWSICRARLVDGSGPGGAAIGELPIEEAIDFRCPYCDSRRHAILDEDIRVLIVLTMRRPVPTTTSGIPTGTMQRPLPRMTERRVTPIRHSWQA